MMVNVADDAHRESSLGTCENAQFVIVMRHTQREDEVNPSWVERASMPWDPPISEQGVGLVGTHAIKAALSVF